MKNKIKFYLIRPFMILSAISLANLFELVFHPTWIPMTTLHQETDLIITHLPISIQINNVLRTYHQLPLWNIFQFSGQPFVADPLTGYWYLPNWLTFIFPYPITFNFLFLVHFFWSGLGMFLFLLKLKLGNVAALFGAICWMGTPKIGRASCRERV